MQFYTDCMILGCEIELTVFIYVEAITLWEIWSLRNTEQDGNLMRERFLLIEEQEAWLFL